MRAGSFADGWVNMARFWKALFDANKSFDLDGSALAPILRLISGGGHKAAPAFTTEQLQEELDKLPVDKAKKYKEALKILIEDYDDVCYTGIEEFKPREDSRPMNVQVQANATDWGTWGGQKSGYVTWNSAKFTLKAKVYQIVSTQANRWELGFVQHCTKKENKGIYSDGAVLSDHPTAGAPWGDSAKDADSPWYTKGMHNGQLAYGLLAGGINTVDYGMDDSFDNRKHPYKAVKTGPVGVDPVAKITQIDCEQDFTTWFGRIDTTRKKNRLLRKVTYSITGKAGINAQNQVSGAKTGVKIGTVETPAFTAPWPAANTKSMNSGEKWFRGGTQI